MLAKKWEKNEIAIIEGNPLYLGNFKSVLFIRRKNDKSDVVLRRFDRAYEKVIEPYAWHVTI
jgi:hypothetical protein